MAKGRKKQTKKIRQKPLNAYCVFCKGENDPSYKDYEELSKFLTERARIISSLRSGVCSKHQRELAIEIKRARHLGLLPFTGSL